jgi:hypothetical protein
MFPKHHQSTALPEAYLLRTSGAKYSKVPLLVTTSSLISDRPKSVNLINPLESIRTFSGLRLNKK